MLNQTIVSRRAVASALPFLALAAPAAALPAPSSDPVFAQIELHKVLRIRANSVPGDHGDPTYDTAQKEEEAAIQALGDMVPATLAGASAQLAYMAEVEGAFADSGSPLLRTVTTVARALAARADI